MCRSPRGHCWCRWRSSCCHDCRWPRCMLEATSSATTTARSVSAIPPEWSGRGKAEASSPVPPSIAERTSSIRMRERLSKMVVSEASPYSANMLPVSQELRYSCDSKIYRLRAKFSGSSAPSLCRPRTWRGELCFCFRRERQDRVAGLSQTSQSFAMAQSGIAMDFQHR